MSIEAFILVGGRSARMGRDKATVRFEGSPMVERVAAAILSALKGVRLRIVAADHQQLLRLGGTEIGDGFVFDIFEHRGPAGGLHSALAHAESEWAFTAACDLPSISSDLVALLYERRDPSLDAVVPLDPAGRPQPLAAFYRVKIVLDRLTELLERPRPAPSMTEVLEGLRVTYVAFSEYEHLDRSHALLSNVNSPEDLAKER